MLRALEGQFRGLSLGQIARATVLPRPTVQRLVDALRAEAFVADDPVRGEVRLGAALTRMAASVRTNLVTFARPLLERLAHTVQETVALSMRRDGQAVVLALVEVPECQIMLTAQVGSAWPIHSTVDGKALLADLTQPVLRATLPSPLPRRTNRTQTSLPALLAELEAVARIGLARMTGHDRGGSARSRPASSTRPAHATRFPSLFRLRASRPTASGSASRCCVAGRTSNEPWD